MIGNALRQLGMFALERALRQDNVLEQHLRNIAKAFALMVMGGLIVTAAFIGGLIAAYSAMVENGVHPGLAVFLIGTVALLSAALCFRKADMMLKEVMPKERKRVLPSVRMDVPLQDGFAIAASSFLKGLRGKGTEASTQGELFEELPDDDTDIIHFRPRKRLES